MIALHARHYYRIRVLEQTKYMFGDSVRKHTFLFLFCCKLSLVIMTVKQGHHHTDIVVGSTARFSCPRFTRGNHFSTH